MESNRGPCRREGRPTAQTRPLEPLGQPAAQAQKGSPEVSTRQPIGKLRDDADIRLVMTAALGEVFDVGRAKGIKLPADAVERILDFIGHAPPAMKASMALDLERGNRLELPWLNGKVVELDV